VKKLGLATSTSLDGTCAITFNSVVAPVAPSPLLVNHIKNTANKSNFIISINPVFVELAKITKNSIKDKF